MLQLPVDGAQAVPALAGVRVEFILFALTLLGVAFFHRRAMQIALGGVLAVLLFKLQFDPAFHPLEHLLGSPEHAGEWRCCCRAAGMP